MAGVNWEVQTAGYYENGCQDVVGALQSDDSE